MADMDIRKAEKYETGVSQYMDLADVALFQNAFGFLNNKDRDILYLIFVSRKKQKEVQRILKRSQPSLCYDIKRIRKRLKFIFYIQSVVDIYLKFLRDVQEDDYRAAQFSSAEISILTLMLYTSSFAMTGSVIGRPAVKVRYVFLRSLEKMKQERMWDIYEIFVIVKNNLNMIRRVYRETHSRRPRKKSKKC